MKKMPSTLTKNMNTVRQGNTFLQLALDQFSHMMCIGSEAGSTIRSNLSMNLSFYSFSYLKKSLSAIRS